MADLFHSTRQVILVLIVAFILLALLVLLSLGLRRMVDMPGSSYRGPFAPLTPAEADSRAALEKHVRVLAREIGPRNTFAYPALAAAASYIEETFTEFGYQVRSQSFEAGGHPVRNLEAGLPGHTRPEEIVVVGAHYDTVVGCPGANDNGSAVAAMLELARLLAGEPLARTVRLVAFVNEEPPYFETELMGSRVYAAEAARRQEQIVAMLSLETIGYYTSAPGSQRYPFPFNLFYPSQGDFIGFVGNLASRQLVRRCVERFRRQAQFPSEGVAAPGWIPGVFWSDHASFWRHGFPAVMVTDTALFRYPYYHTPQDTVDKLDYPRLARVVRGLAHLIQALANASD